MGFLGKLFGSKGKDGAVVTEAGAVSCPHVTLVPRWDSAADMGNDSKATSYVCQACRQTFTREEAQTLRQTEGERLREELGEPETETTA